MKKLIFIMSVVMTTLSMSSGDEKKEGYECNIGTFDLLRPLDKKIVIDYFGKPMSEYIR